MEARGHAYGAGATDRLRTFSLRPDDAGPVARAARDAFTAQDAGGVALPGGACGAGHYAAGVCATRVDADACESERAARLHLGAPAGIGRPGSHTPVY